ncbi:MAG: hypothetical protein NTW28_35955, partial [Candidatus Solibacter sp.]|nr:hypothetical protein [Candidatus Solibacter sp.]
VGKFAAFQLELEAVSWWPSSVLRPLPGLDRRYQLRPGRVMQAYRKLTEQLRRTLQGRLKDLDAAGSYSTPGRQN